MYEKEETDIKEEVLLNKRWEKGESIGSKEGN
jgi:hypothetical protein